MATTTDRSDDPLEQLLDLFVYAPIGLVVRGTESFPELVAKGRSKAQMARVVGTFALGAGNTKVREAIGQAESHLGEFLRIVATAASPSPAATGTGSEAPDHPDDSAAVSDGIDDLVPGYDDLPAKAVLPLLTDLRPEALRRVGSHERSHRGRKTVLNRLQQLRG
jgi:hypothetical protein